MFSICSVSSVFKVQRLTVYFHENGKNVSILVAEIRWYTVSLCHVIQTRDMWEEGPYAEKLSAAMSAGIFLISNEERKVHLTVGGATQVSWLWIV